MTGFVDPPWTTTEKGAPRRVGVEIEFHGLDAQGAARIAARALGGTPQRESAHAATLETDLGPFRFELDTAFAKPADPPEDDADAMDRAASAVRGALRGAAVDALSAVAPVEMVAPPIPYDRLDALSDVIAALREAGAEGTRAHPLYAFGLHLNPEAPSLAPGRIWRLFTAYAFAEPWLRSRIAPDVSRRLTPFIDPYPARAVRAAAAAEPPARVGDLIDFYVHWLRSRNFGLDLLPLLAHLDRDRLERGFGAPVGAARPTFHYRLPDCRIDDPAWSLTRPWGEWVAIERLAADDDAHEKARRLWALSGLLTPPDPEALARIMAPLAP